MTLSREEISEIILEYVGDVEQKTYSLKRKNVSEPHPLLIQLIRKTDCDELCLVKLSNETYIIHTDCNGCPYDDSDECPSIKIEDQPYLVDGTGPDYESIDDFERQTGQVFIDILERSILSQI